MGADHDDNSDVADGLGRRPSAPIIDHVNNLMCGARFTSTRVSIFLTPPATASHHKSSTVGLHLCHPCLQRRDSCRPSIRRCKFILHWSDSGCEAECRARTRKYRSFIYTSPRLPLLHRPRPTTCLIPLSRPPALTVTFLDDEQQFQHLARYCVSKCVGTRLLLLSEYGSPKLAVFVLVRDEAARTWGGVEARVRRQRSVGLDLVPGAPHTSRLRMIRVFRSHSFCLGIYSNREASALR